VTISDFTLLLFEVESKDALPAVVARLHPRAWLNDNRANSVYYKQSPSERRNLQETKTIFLGIDERFRKTMITNEVLRGRSSS